jgi:hypothetical protein
MIQLKGSVTTVERMDVEVTPQELSKHTIKNFTPYEITRMAYASWLAGKGMGTDVQLKQNSLGAYYFQEYENNGSHYSGYYEVSNAYKEGDEVIWEQFHQLLNTLK